MNNFHFISSRITVSCHTTVTLFWRGKFLHYFLWRNSILDIDKLFPGRTPDLRSCHLPQRLTPPRLHLYYPPPPPSPTPSRRWQRQEGGRQAQMTINLGSGRHAVALVGQWRCNARTAALLGQEGGGGHAAVLDAQQQGIRGGEGCWRRWVCSCIVGVAAALFGCEGSGRRG